MQMLVTNRASYPVSGIVTSVQVDLIRPLAAFSVCAQRMEKTVEMERMATICTPSLRNLEATTDTRGIADYAQLIIDGVPGVYSVQFVSSGVEPPLSVSYTVLLEAAGVLGGLGRGKEGMGMSQLLLLLQTFKFRSIGSPVMYTLDPRSPTRTCHSRSSCQALPPSYPISSPTQVILASKSGAALADRRVVFLSISDLAVVGYSNMSKLLFRTLDPAQALRVGKIGAERKGGEGKGREY